MTTDERRVPVFLLEGAHVPDLAPKTRVSKIVEIKLYLGKK